jgi:hypothetical protein
MRRGFKSQAEKISFELRSEFGLSAFDPLDPEAFLASLGITIWTPAEIPGIDPHDVEQLTTRDPDAWSGATIREGDDIVIVINPTHPATRRTNTLMHEWAHIRLHHKPNRVDRSDAGLLLLSEYPVEIEEEADWLAGAILLPRDGLIRYRGRGWSGDAISNHYGVSEKLTNWRLRMTGVERQLKGHFG